MRQMSHPLSISCHTLCSISGITYATSAIIRVRSSMTFAGIDGMNTHCLRNLHKKKSRGVGSGEWGGHAIGATLSIHSWEIVCWGTCTLVQGNEGAGKPLLYNPAPLRLQVFQSVHDLSHPGAKATAKLVAQLTAPRVLNPPHFTSCPRRTTVGIPAETIEHWTPVPFQTAILSLTSTTTLINSPVAVSSPRSSTQLNSGDTRWSN
jgi:hypothetical protein